MNQSYKDYKIKFARFNRWEEEQETKKSKQQKMAEFMHLFELSMQMPEDIKEQAHKDHLENLIEERKRLKDPEKISG